MSGGRWRIAAVFVGGTLAIGVAAYALFHSAVVPVDPPEASTEQTATCRDLQTLLPDPLDGRPSRQTGPLSPLTAAWGDPPVVLRCGVPRPAALTLTSQLFQANGVSWFAEQVPGGWRFTATGRKAYVEVTVPGTQDQASAPLVDLAPAVSNAVPVRADGRP